jgi:hypothetical protein
LGITRHRTTAYHPQSIGTVERSHRTLQQCLRTLGESQCWESSLPLALLAMRTTTSAATQFPPSQLVFGGSVRIPADFLLPQTLASPLSTHDFAQRILQRAQQLLHIADDNQKSRPYTSVQALPHWVWLRQPATLGGSLKSPFTGPYQVLRQDNTVVTISVNGKPSKVSVDRLKPAMLDDYTADDTMKPPAPIDTTHPDTNLGSEDASNHQTSSQLTDPGGTNPRALENVKISKYGRTLPFRFTTPRYVFVRSRHT